MILHNWRHFYWIFKGCIIWHHYNQSTTKWRGTLLCFSALFCWASPPWIGWQAATSQPMSSLLLWERPKTSTNRSRMGRPSHRRPRPFLMIWTTVGLRLGTWWLFLLLITWTLWNTDTPTINVGFGSTELRWTTIDTLDWSSGRTGTVSDGWASIRKQLATKTPQIQHQAWPIGFLVNTLVKPWTTFGVSPPLTPHTYKAKILLWEVTLGFTL